MAPPERPVDPAFGTSTDDAIAEGMAWVDANQRQPETIAANRAAAVAALTDAWIAMERARSALTRFERGRNLRDGSRVTPEHWHLTNLAAREANGIQNLRDALDKEPV